jgi:hypothetical protein
MNRQELCFEKAIKMIELGVVQLSEEMDVFKLTDLLIKLEEEKEYKNNKSDNLIDYNDEIVDIKDVGVMDTIDISVSGDNLFYCNDILTKNSFGLPATADFMFALITNEELEALNQILVKQLKNRYSDLNHYKRFVIGIDRSKMKLYDVEESAQTDIIDSGQEDTPPLNTFGNRENKFRKKFDGLKV